MNKSLLHNALTLVAILLCSLTANAYDFEVYGLRYTKTSDTTVEVTDYDDYYRYYQNDDYTDKVYIPSRVEYNNVFYTVSSIGDRAFYSSNIRSVIIPETVTSIGIGAFQNCCGLSKVTCLAKTPPSLNNSFDDNYEECLLLIVNNEAYGDYISAYEGYNIFSRILCKYKGAPLDLCSIYGFIDGFVLFLYKYENVELFVTGKEVWTSGYSDGWGGADFGIFVEENDYDYYIFNLDYYMLRYLIIDWYAIIDDLYYVGETYDMQLYKDDLSWNICKDYIYYSFNSDYTHVEKFDWLGVSFDGVRNTEQKDWPGDKYSYYSGDVKIPSSVNYAIWDIPVKSIDDYAFSDCEDLISVTLPNTIKSIGYEAFKGANHLKKLVLPVSITNIDPSAFEDCTSESVYLTGEGEWQGGTLPGGVKTLYIGSGVTGVKGMKVNPETIYSYATTPPICDENSFTGYDGELHVPASSLAAYFTAPYWCNFTNIIGDAVALTDLTLSQDSIELLVGAEATLRATIAPANAAPANITWQSSDTTVAKVEDGLVTALKRGSCDIIATCQDKRAVCHVTVTEILPTSVALSQETAKIEVGSQLELTATVLPEDATDKTVLWSSSNNSVATVDENGVVTGVGQGECDITAWCHGKSAQCHVIVVEHLIYISLDQHEASVLPNHIITLTPTVAPVSTDLVVTSSNPEVAAARLAGNKIQVVGIKEGTATIVVNSADGYAEPDSCVARVYTERGDVNSDGFVDINDVTVLIDYLLGTSPQSFSSENADTNNDGDVDINDVTMLIDYLLGAVELQPKDEYTQEFTVNGVTFTMVRVEGGSFTMGATEEEDSDYQVFKGSPQHQVTLSGYSIGQTEVTQELWLAVMGNNPSHDTSDLQYPVDGVSWNDCAEFIALLNQLTGKQFRLPTEAEWEYAAKGGSKSQGYVYSGCDDLDEVAWTNANSDGRSHQVATKKANELGLFDMNGNIEEWCNDWYSLYTADPVVNPTGPETGTSRMHRGGRWASGSKFCRLTRRDGFAPTVARNYLGLRLAL